MNELMNTFGQTGVTQGFDKISISIQNHIDDLILDQTINEILNAIIEKTISECKDKKFDFCLPFD